MDNQEEENEEQIKKELEELKTFQNDSLQFVNELKFDFDSDDSNSIEILLKLAKPHLQTDAEHRAFRHLSKRLEDV